MDIFCRQGGEFRKKLEVVNHRSQDRDSVVDFKGLTLLYKGKGDPTLGGSGCVLYRGGGARENIK